MTLKSKRARRLKKFGYYAGCKKIGKGSKIENVILDKDVEIGSERTLIGAHTSPLIISKGEKNLGFLKRGIRY
ncbi:MAG: hypothetical protein L6V93_19525 [Clostridiales bacterium]|nr:MAG: hypothetical protein L6V93_19525 [Clostridiales bacterium]